MNKQKILKQMTKVVKETMTRNQELDFYKCDTNTINRLKDEELPLIWAVGTASTYIFCPQSEAELFHPSSQTYLNYLNERTLPLQFLWESEGTLQSHRFFLITPKGVNEIQRYQIKEVMRDMIIPVIERLKAENGGKLPPYVRQ